MKTLRYFILAAKGSDEMDFKRYHRINSKGKMRLSPALEEYQHIETAYGWMPLDSDSPIYITSHMDEPLIAAVMQTEEIVEIPVEERALILPLKWKERLGRRAVLIKRRSLLEVWPFVRWMELPEVLTSEIQKRGEIVEGPAKPDHSDEVSQLESEIAALCAERDKISEEISKKYDEIMELIDW